MVAKEYQIVVNGQCLVNFHISFIRMVFLCNVMPMDTCHVLSRRPWKFDRDAIYDGRMNTYTSVKGRSLY